MERQKSSCYASRRPAVLARRSQRLRRTPALQISTVLAQTTLNGGGFSL